MALILCFTMVFTMTSYVGLGDYTQVYAESSAEEVINQEAIQAEKTIYEQLVSCASVEEMYLLMLEFMNEDPQGLESLSTQEINGLRKRVEELQPENDDVDKIDLLDTLSILPNGGQEQSADIDTYVLSRTGAQLLATASGGVIKLTDNVRLSSTLTINGGKKITLDLAGYVLEGNGTNEVITVSGAGTNLTIIDSNDTIGHDGRIIDGVYDWANGSGDIIRGGVITNQAKGPGITVTENALCTINDGLITGCVDKVGPAITLTSTGNLVMTGGEVMYNKSLNATGASGGAIHGEPSNSSNTGSNMQLSNVKIQYNTSSANGGAIYGYDVTLDNCIITNNTAHYGGGIYIPSGSSKKETKGTLKVQNSTIGNNTAQYGGGIYAKVDTKVEINSNTTISGNNASVSGGGIYAYSLDAIGTFDKPIIISNNKAVNNGGGICINGPDTNPDRNSVCTIEHCTIERNDTGISGGGIYAYLADVKVSNSKISYNRAMTTETYDNVDSKTRVDKGRGGGFWFQGKAKVAAPKCELINTEVTNNAAMYYGGGGQVCTYAELELVSGKISDNIVILHGAGGLHVTGDAKFTLTGGEISNNTAYSVGGGIHSSYTCVLNLDGGEIKNNTVYGRGGGVHVNVGGNLQLKGTDIIGNEAHTGTTRYAAEVVEFNGNNWPGVINIRETATVDGYGGGVVVDAGTCTMTEGKLFDNWAEVGGGGIAFVMINAAAGNHGRFSENRVVEFDLKGGEITNNRTDGNGAGVYLMKNRLSEEELLKDESADRRYYDEEGNLYHLEGVPNITATGGIVKGNVANGNGGAAYQEEKTKFVISDDALFIENEAKLNGGGVYIAQGEAEINGGAINNNKSNLAGGGLYIAGNVTMSDGTVSENTAVTSGGAAYIDGGKFTMTSGRMEKNKTTGKDSNGGAVLLNNGSAEIGIKDCSGEGTTHTEEPTDKIHPIIKDNTSLDSGGGIALLGNGDIVMYCGEVVGNKATNPGRGLNVYMETGTFDLYNGDIGAIKNPELVIVGGHLIKHENSSVDVDIELKYYHCNDEVKFTEPHTGDFGEKTATATKGEYFNLPDGEKYWSAPDGYRFFGWTFYGPNDDDAPAFVRNKGEYQPIGSPILVKDDSEKTYDKVIDGIITMYALWAPEVSEISYQAVTFVNGAYTELSDGEVSQMNGAVGNPTEYTYSVGTNTSLLKDVTKSGYTFKGWYIYQDLNQNANWGYEPAYKEVGGVTVIDYERLTFIPAGTDIDFGSTNFGDVTLIARFEPAFTDLRVTKEGASEKDTNQTFIFRVTGTPDDTALPKVDMTVTVQGNSSVLIVDLPVGDYQVEEITQWSWRYIIEGTNPKDVALRNPEKRGDNAENVKFENKRENFLWLSGDSFCDNLWSGANNSVIKRIFS